MACSFEFHNELHGLGYKDRIKIFSGSKNAKTFKKPIAKEIKGNSNYMDELIEKYNRENR